MLRILYLTTILSAAWVLNGCGLFAFYDDDTNVVELAKNILKEQQNEHGEQIRVTMPLRVNYTISRKAEIDKDLLIEFEFVTEKALPIVRFAVKTTDGLDLVKHNIESRYDALKAREVIKSRVIVTPLHENKFYLDLFVITEIGEEKLARLIRIPIAVGDYSLSDHPKGR